MIFSIFKRDSKYFGIVPQHFQCFSIADEKHTNIFSGPLLLKQPLKFLIFLAFKTMIKLHINSI